MNKMESTERLPSSFGSNSLEDVFISNSTVFGGHDLEDRDPHYSAFAFGLSFVTLGVTCVIGFVGNTLTIVTFSRHHDFRQSVTQFLLTALAAADLSFLASAVVLIMPESFCECHKSICSDAARDAIVMIDRYGWTVGSATHVTTVYMTVLLALHRYVHVCHSRDVHRLSGMRRAKIHAALVPCFAVLYSLPRLVEFHADSAESKPSSGTARPTDPPRGKNKLSEIGSSVWFQVVYKNILFYLFVIVIPVTILTFVTVKLIMALRMRQRNRPRFTVKQREQSRDDKVTMMLIVVIVVFIVCQTPTAIQRLMLTLSGNRGNIYRYVEKLCDYLAVLNSCVNFFVYVLFSPHFRQILMAEVVPGCSTRDPSSETMPSEDKVQTSGRISTKPTQTFKFS